MKAIQSIMSKELRWEFYQDKKGEWRWKTFAKNGVQVGASTEGYTTKQNAVKNAKIMGYSVK